MLSRQQILAYLENQKKYFRSHFRLEKIGLFGSCAREDQSTSSDIDILFEVIPNTKFSLFKYLELKKYLEDGLQMKVDLVREATLKEIINPHIQRDLIFTDLRIFNEDTATAIKEAQEGNNLIKHTSQEKLFNDLSL